MCTGNRTICHPAESYRIFKSWRFLYYAVASSAMLSIFSSVIGFLPLSQTYLILRSTLAYWTCCYIFPIKCMYKSKYSSSELCIFWLRVYKPTFLQFRYCRSLSFLIWFFNWSTNWIHKMFLSASECITSVKKYWNCTNLPDHCQMLIISNYDFVWLYYYELLKFNCPHLKWTHSDICLRIGFQRRLH